jgi:hypothetical protein
VGYRLERLGGAIAVTVFSAVIWSCVAASEWGIFQGAAFGGLVGFAVALRTRE